MENVHVLSPRKNLCSRHLLLFLRPFRPHSSMDRMWDSGSHDVGSIPAEATQSLVNRLICKAFLLGVFFCIAIFFLSLYFLWCYICIYPRFFILKNQKKQLKRCAFNVHFFLQNCLPILAQNSVFILSKNLFLQKNISTKNQFTNKLQPRMSLWSNRPSTSKLPSG